MLGSPLISFVEVLVFRGGGVVMIIRARIIDLAHLIQDGNPGNSGDHQNPRPNSLIVASHS